MDKKKVHQRIDRILKAAASSAVTKEGKSRVEDIQIYTGYSEPGYDKDAIAALGNWNKITKWNGSTHTELDDIMSRVGDALEKIGCELEWEDEWTSCSHCGKLIRTSPDSYHWTAQYVVGDGEISCHKCIKEDPESHLISLEDCPTNANTIDSIHPKDYGYVLYKDDLQAGYHPGQTDNPTTIAKELRHKGIYRFLFHIDGVGQFDTHFSCWIHEEEKEKLNDEIPESDPMDE